MQYVRLKSQEKYTDRDVVDFIQFAGEALLVAG